MGIFDLFGGRKSKEVSAPRENREDLGEGMELVNISLFGYWKPRYLVDKRKNKRIEFMSENECFCTVEQDDIDWDLFRQMRAEAEAMVKAKKIE